MARAWPSTKGMPLIFAQVGKPVPREHALAANDDVLAEGLDRRAGIHRGRREILLEAGLALVIEHMDEHVSGVEIDAAIELVLAIVVVA